MLLNSPNSLFHTLDTNYLQLIQRRQPTASTTDAEMVDQLWPWEDGSYRWVLRPWLANLSSEDSEWIRRSGLTGKHDQGSNRASTPLLPYTDEVHANFFITTLVLWKALDDQTDAVSPSPLSAISFLYTKVPSGSKTQICLKYDDMAADDAYKTLLT